MAGARNSTRLNVTLDPEHAEKLSRMAEQGPWRWLVTVYDHYEDEDRVVIVTVQDGRSSQSASERRR
jgi:hypothetical protein